LELIRHGANKAFVAGRLGTPLHQAALCSHLIILKSLLDYGCPLDTLNTTGYTVLHAAASGGDVDVIRELINRGCDVNATNKDMEQTKPL
jgi:serine/threonine-protein phosphatase 6 regulatory ankyrin repeat subunit B